MAKYVERLLGLRGRPAGASTRRGDRMSTSTEPVDCPVPTGRSGCGPTPGSTRSTSRSPRSPPAGRSSSSTTRIAGERGRPDLRGRTRHSGADRVHGALHLRLHLRADHRGRGRPAGPAADVADQPGPARHRVHRHRRRQDRDHHRDLGRRPGAHHPAARRSGRRRPPTSPGPGTWCRCAPATAACWSVPGTPRPRSTSRVLAGLQPGRRALRDRQREGSARHGPHRRAAGLRRRPRPRADLHRRPDRLPPPAREVQIEQVADARLPLPQGEFRGGRVPVHGDRAGAGGAGPRRPRGRRGRAGPGALRMPDRRRAGFAALRLRPAAARRPRGGRRGGPRRGPLHPRSRGPRHRPAAEAARLRTAGRRAPTPSTPTSRSVSRPTPASTAPAPRCWPTSGSGRCGC